MNPISLSHEIKQSILENPKLLKTAPLEIKKDAEIVYQVYKKLNSSLKWADITAVYKILDLDPNSYLYASHLHFKSKAYVMKAISLYTRYSVHPLKLASSDLKEDKEVVELAVSIHSWAIEHASMKYLNENIDLVYYAIHQNVRNLNYAPIHLKKDAAFIAYLVQNVSAKAICYADKSVKEMREIVLNAVILEPGCLLDPQIASIYKNNRNFLLDAIERNKDVFRWIQLDYRLFDSSFMADSLLKNPGVLEYLIPSILESDPYLIPFVKEAIIKDPQVLKFAPKSHKNRYSYGFYAALLKRFNAIFEFIPKDLQSMLLVQAQLRQIAIKEGKELHQILPLSKLSQVLELTKYQRFF